MSMRMSTWSSTEARFFCARSGSLRLLPRQPRTTSLTLRMHAALFFWERNLFFSTRSRVMCTGLTRFSFCRSESILFLAYETVWLSSSSIDP